MGELLSTNKPDVPKKPEVKIEYNDRSYQDYIDKGFADSIPHKIEAPHTRIQQFLSLVDIRKGPVERTVTSIVRLKAIDYDNPTHAARTEWIYYTEDWTGKNWLGIPIEQGIGDHIEGRYMEVVTRPKLDERTGEHIENVFAGTRERYYIPFSKKNVDDIIAKSAHSTKQNIRFIVKWGTEDSPDGTQMSTRNAFPYDVFLWEWEKLSTYQYWPTSDMINRPKAGKTSATKLEFRPS